MRVPQREPLAFQKHEYTPDEAFLAYVAWYREASLESMSELFEVEENYGDIGRIIVSLLFTLSFGLWVGIIIGWY